MTQEGLLRASVLYCSKRPWDYLAPKLLCFIGWIVGK